MSTSRSAPTISSYALKRRWVHALRTIQRRAVERGISANAVTLAAVPVATAVGVALWAGRTWPAAWFAVLPLTAVQLALNALDGSLAAHTGTATRLGAVLNEAGDRYADLVVVIAVALVTSPWLALAAGAGIAAAEAAALLGWALTGSRPMEGPMAKPDRALLLGAAAAASVWWAAALPVALGTVAAGGAVTAVRRVAVVLGEER